MPFLIIGESISWISKPRGSVGENGTPSEKDGLSAVVAVTAVRNLRSMPSITMEPLPVPEARIKEIASGFFRSSDGPTTARNLHPLPSKEIWERALVLIHYVNGRK